GNTRRSFEGPKVPAPSQKRSADEIVAVFSKKYKEFVKSIDVNHIIDYYTQSKGMGLEVEGLWLEVVEGLWLEVVEGLGAFEGDGNGSLSPEPHHLASGVAEEVTEKTILLGDLATQVDEANNEEMRRASTEDSTAARSEEAGALVRDEAMKSQAKRKAEDGDGGSNAELDLRKFMFARELEERKKDREREVEERQRDFEERKMDRQREVNERQKDREVQMQQMQVMQSAMTTVLDALVKKF
ncbi:hypothetical protein DYB25_001395, partial [Aphanomyces astaci]